MNPDKLLFAKTHEWVTITSEGAQKVATVGLSAFAVKALTDLVFIELPKVGRKVTAGESFCEVESVKAVSDVYAPVSGEVVESNADLAANFALVNEDAECKAWFFKIKLSDPGELDKLMDRAAYDAFVKDAG